MVMNRQDMADLVDNDGAEIVEVETDEEGYITRIRLWSEDKPINLYPATENKIGVAVTD